MKGYKQTERHGCTGMPELYVWNSMRARCGFCHHPKYPRYGGRGIKVCERWQNSFLAFLEDMGNCPKGLTLDRINNNGDYEPSNCRWTTRLSQQNNRACNVLLTFNGKTQTLSIWAREVGIKAKTLDARIKRGWETERALTTPV